MRFSVISVLALALLVPVTWADENDGGTIVGTVIDDHGSPMPGAELWLQQRSGNIERRWKQGYATAGESGRFVFANLPPGEYVISARLFGFVSEKIVSLRIEPRHTVRADFRMVFHLGVKEKRALIASSIR